MKRLAYNISTSGQVQEQRRSQHAKDQEEPKLKVNQVPSTRKKTELKFYKKKKQRQPSLHLKGRRFLYVQSIRLTTTKTTPTIYTKTESDHSSIESSTDFRSFQIFHSNLLLLRAFNFFIYPCWEGVALFVP